MKREYLGERFGRHVMVMRSTRRMAGRTCPRFYEGVSFQREKSIFMRDLLFSGACPCGRRVERSSVEVKGIWWMPWRQEAMKDVARCEKLRGGASAR